MPDQDTTKYRALVGGAYTAKSTGAERTFGPGDLVPADELPDDTWLIGPVLVSDDQAPAPGALRDQPADDVLVAYAYQGADAKAVRERQAADAERVEQAQQGGDA